MKKEYIIDENVILNAWHGKRPDNSLVLSEKKLLYDIFYGEYRIFISEKISKMGKKRPTNNSDLDNFVLKMILKIIFDSERTTILDGIKTDFQRVKKCDNEFIGVTLQSNAILVMADKKLKEAISKDEKVSHCVCMIAEEIIEENMPKEPSS